jgi:hypothetical protein
VLLEHAQHPREIEQRPAQTVDFIYHDAIQFARFDCVEQPCQSGPVHVGAGEAAVVIELGQRDPAFAPLTPNESLGSLALRIERVEFLIETLFGRLPRVDRRGDEAPLGSEEGSVCGKEDDT